MRRFSATDATRSLFVLALVTCSAPALAEETARLAPLELTGGLRAAQRTLEYHDTPAELYPNRGLNTLLTYKQPLSPSAFLQLNLFPAAFVSRGADANLGVTASYEVALPTSVLFGEGTDQEVKLTSHASEFFVGLRGRLPISVHELGLVAGYGQHRYDVEGDEKSPLVPDVRYDFVRLSVDTTLRFDALRLGAHAGTRIVQSTGGLQKDWFPSTKTTSLEAGLVAGYEVSPRLEILAGFDVIRYAFDFNPIPANADPTYVAGGGVDQYSSGWLALRFSLSGAAAASVAR
jgi:hypothetical protein